VLTLDGTTFATWLERHAGTSVIVFEHLTAIAAAGVLILLWIAGGAWVRRTVDGAVDPSTEDVRDSDSDSRDAHLIVDAMIGAGGLALLMLGLSGFHMLTPPVVLVTTGLASVALRREMREALTRVGAITRAVSPTLRVTGTVLLLCLLVPALLPPSEWDTLMYHLRLPLGALEQGSLQTPADALAFSALIGVAHLAAIPLLALGLLEGPGVLNVLLLPLIAVGTAALARSIAPQASRAVAAATLLGCPALILVAWSARIDTIFAAAILATHLAVVHGVRTRRMGAMILAALAAATSLGVKSLAAAYLVALVPLVLVPGRLPLRLLVWTGVVSCVAAAPWLLKSWLIAGTPLYPIGFAGTLDPWLATLAAEQSVTALDRTALGSLWLSREPFNLWDAFFAPGRLTIEGEGRFYALSPALLLLPLGFAVRAHRLTWLVHALVPMLFIAVIVGASAEINLRYLMAAYPALAAVTGAAVGAFVAGDRFARGLRRILLVAVGVAALWPTLRFLDVRLPTLRTEVAHALGQRDGVPQWQRLSTMNTLAAISDTISALGGERDTVLLLWEARALALRQPVLMDAFNANWPILAQLPAASQCLRGTGVRWLVVGSGSLSYYTTRGAPRGIFRLEALDTFRTRCLGDPVFSSNGFVVLPLRNGE